MSDFEELDEEEEDLKSRQILIGILGLVILTFGLLITRKLMKKRKGRLV